MEKNIIVAVDFGTTKLTMVAAQKDASGHLKILAFESESMPSGVIANGLIIKPSDVGATLLRIKQYIINRFLPIKVKIETVYASIGGRSLRTFEVQKPHNFNKPTELTIELLESLTEDVYRSNIGGRKIYNIFPQEFSVDGSTMNFPQGELCNSLLGRYLTVVGKEIIETNLNKTLSRAKIVAEEMQFSILSVASAVLTTADKQNGCCVIDFGASTTSMAVYRDQKLQHAAVIPFGSKHITRDICSLGLREEEAEKLKIKNGVALKDKVSVDESYKFAPMNVSSEIRYIKATELAEVIQMRMDEIIYLVWQQVLQTNLQDKLEAGIIITGGGSQLNAIDELITLRTNLQVKYGDQSQYLTSDSNILLFEPAFSQIVGQLLDGSVNCVEVVEEILDTPITDPEPKAKVKKTNPIKSFIGNLFAEETPVKE